MKLRLIDTLCNVHSQDMLERRKGFYSWVQWARDGQEMIRVEIWWDVWSRESASRLPFDTVCCVVFFPIQYVFVHILHANLNWRLNWKIVCCSDDEQDRILWVQAMYRATGQTHKPVPPTQVQKLTAGKQGQLDAPVSQFCKHCYVLWLGVATVMRCALSNSAARFPSDCCVVLFWLLRRRLNSPAGDSMTAHLKLGGGFIEEPLWDFVSPFRATPSGKGPPHRTNAVSCWCRSLASLSLSIPHPSLFLSLSTPLFSLRPMSTPPCSKSALLEKALIAVLFRVSSFSSLSKALYSAFLSFSLLIQTLVCGPTFAWVQHNRGGKLIPEGKKQTNHILINPV